jgi:hypothetical protein
LVRKRSRNLFFQVIERKFTMGDEFCWQASWSFFGGEKQIGVRDARDIAARAMPRLTRLSFQRRRTQAGAPRPPRAWWATAGYRGSGGRVPAGELRPPQTLPPMTHG